MSNEENRELDQELEELKTLIQGEDDNTASFTLEDILAEADETAREVPSEDAAPVEEAAPAEEAVPAEEADSTEEPAAVGSEPPKKKKRGSVAYYALMAVFVGVFIYSAVYIGNYVIDFIKGQNLYNDMANGVDDLRGQYATTAPPQQTDPNASRPNAPTLPGQPTLRPDETGPAPTEPTPTLPSVLPEYEAMYEKNNDMVGWIKIEDTNVNYPIMQTPNSPDYYLHRNFDKEWSFLGCIYAREQCDIFTPSDNVVLYGHSTDTLMMFQNIKKYKNKSFWNDHQTFLFDTIYERHTYQVIACFYTTADVGNPDYFPYHQFNDAKDEAEFNKFMETVHARQLYDTGLTAQYGDKLVTLSTCQSHSIDIPNARFVVIAKRIT